MEREIAKAPRYIFQAHHLAETLKLKTLEPSLGMSAITRTSLKLVYEDGEASFIFLYSFGALVFFNVDPARQTAFIEKLKVIVGKSDVLVTSDEYALEVQEGVKNEVQFERVVMDRLTLDRINLLALILAQSTTLEYFEIKVDELLRKTSEISEHLKRKGQLKRSVKEIYKFVGYCMSTKQELVTSMYLLDRPDETWQDQVLDSLHRDASEMFELRSRYKTIDYKLKMIQENLELIGDLLSTRKGELLEVLIILLIAVEIALFMYELWWK